ncbi:MAG: hypothetical protein Q8R55_01250 [Candidatus Taylorbacteria bacterium]|nr:hypothetical protein [Candidatus Taylorbacteria bacterium]
MDNLNPSDISSSPIPSPQKENPPIGGQSKKTFFKHWSGVAVLVILAALVTWGLLNLPTIINAVQEKLTAWQYQRELDKLEAPYRNDKYGGKTPEETFDMFIDALKKEDVELASKYFVIQKQDDWKKTIGEYKNKALLGNFIGELQQNRNSWQLLEKDENNANFQYTFVVDKPFTENLPLGDGRTQEVSYPAGEYGAEIKFEKYPTGVWKIDLL